MHQHTRSHPLCVTHTGPVHTHARARTQTRNNARTRTHTHARTRTHARSTLAHTLSWQVLKTDKGSVDFDKEMARTGAMGGMDSAPPAFIGLTAFVVAYLVYLVVAA